MPWPAVQWRRRAHDVLVAQRHTPDRSHHEAGGEISARHHLGFPPNPEHLRDVSSEFACQRRPRFSVLRERHLLIAVRPVTEILLGLRWSAEECAERLQGERLGEFGDEFRFIARQ